MVKVLEVHSMKTHHFSPSEVEEVFQKELCPIVKCSENSGTVLFTKDAWDELCTYIHWGRQHPNNKNEQQLAAVGYKCYDSDADTHFIIVCHVLYKYCSKRSSVSAGQVTPHRQVMVDAQMDEEVAFINAARTYGNPVYHKLGDVGVVANIHTHPNMDVFLSGTDRKGHISGSDFWVDLVVNPQDKKIAAFGGQEAKECNIYLLNDMKKTVPPSESAKKKSFVYRTRSWIITEVFKIKKGVDG